MPAGRVRVFIASSVDGFIAGADDDLSWLPPPTPGAPDEHGYETFIGEVGALLMGRRTFEVVLGFGGEWPYGERPVLVATHRPLPAAPDRVQAVQGPVEALVDRALEAAGGRDVYLDGGELIRAALDARRLDELVVTLIPVVLGEGRPLFAGVRERHPLELAGHRTTPGGLLQLTYRPLDARR